MPPRFQLTVEGGINIYNSVSNNMVNGFSGGLSYSGGMEYDTSRLLSNYNIDPFGLKILYIITEDYLRDLAKANSGKNNPTKEDIKKAYDKIRVAQRQHNNINMPKDLQVTIARVKSLKQANIVVATNAVKGDHIIFHAHDNGDSRNIVINKGEIHPRIPAKPDEGFGKFYKILLLTEVKSYTMSFCLTTNQDAKKIHDVYLNGKIDVFYTWIEHTREWGDFGVVEKNGKYVFDPHSADKNIVKVPK